MNRLRDVIPITDPDDARVALYRNVRDKTLAARHGVFLAEGEFLVQRVLDSTYKVISVFVSEKRLQRLTLRIPKGITVYTAPETLLSKTVGFHFHRGVLAAARRKPFLSERQLFSEAESWRHMLVLPEINNTENLGLILRSASGLGFKHIVLGPRCCDPFSRRTLRTGMGASLRLYLAKSHNLRQTFKWLEQEQIPVHAAALTPNAQSLETIRPPRSVALVLGPEAYGLSEHWLNCCERIVKIPMHNQTDSLNVGVAAGIFMYHYSRHKST